LKIRSDIRSPNVGVDKIPVEFLVIHYTACDLKRTLSLFLDPGLNLSTHIVIAENGDIYELVECFGGVARMAHHAGESFWRERQKKWRGFNNFSLGIELVNQNGNILAYSDQQYQALRAVVRELQSSYPKLNSPDRILGHEHIAGWRGKVDPGYMFNWNRFYRDCFPKVRAPRREGKCPKAIIEALKKFLVIVPDKRIQKDAFWHALNFIAETSLALINQASVRKPNG